MRHAQAAAVLAATAALATAAGVAAFVPAATAAGAPPRLATYVDRFTTDHPGASSGRHARTDIVSPTDRDGKPASFSHVHVQFAPGTVVDTGALPRCGASDAELMASGASACSRSSVVGKGFADLDTGVPGPNRHILVDIVFVNARDQLVFVTTQRGNGARVILRGNYSHGNQLDVDVPPIPGTPPDGAAETAERIDLAPHTSGGRAYVRTPPSCPRSGRWTNAVTYTFRDGVKQTFTTTSPCHARAGGHRKRLAVRVRGVPHRRCLRRAFRVRVTATAPARRLTLYLDGRRVRKARAHRLTARIPVRSLRRGRHRLKAIARDGNGHAAVRRVRFRRC
jgi:hypothetical protein